MTTDHEHTEELFAFLAVAMRALEPDPTKEVTLELTPATFTPANDDRGIFMEQLEDGTWRVTLMTRAHGIAKAREAVERARRDPNIALDAAGDLTGFPLADDDTLVN